MLGFIGTAMLMLAAHSSKRQGLNGTPDEHRRRHSWLTNKVTQSRKQGYDTMADRYEAQAEEEDLWFERDGVDGLSGLGGLRDDEYHDARMEVERAKWRLIGCKDDLAVAEHALSVRAMAVRDARVAKYGRATEWPEDMDV